MNSCIGKYSDALDFIFNDLSVRDVAIPFRSNGYALALVIKNSKTEIIIYNQNP